MNTNGDLSLYDVMGTGVEVSFSSPPSFRSFCSCLFVSGESGANDSDRDEERHLKQGQSSTLVERSRDGGSLTAKRENKEVVGEDGHRHHGDGDGDLRMEIDVVVRPI